MRRSTRLLSLLLLLLALGLGGRLAVPGARRRVELLYPVAQEQLIELIASYPNLKEIVWLQEEPSNMGARKWLVPQLADIAPAGVPVRWISRPERSSPAEGYPAAHQAEQTRLVTEALA